MKKHVNAAEQVSKDTGVLYSLDKRDDSVASPQP